MISRMASEMGVTASTEMNPSSMSTASDRPAALTDPSMVSSRKYCSVGTHAVAIAGAASPKATSTAMEESVRPTTREATAGALGVAVAGVLVARCTVARQFGGSKTPSTRSLIPAEAPLEPRSDAAPGLATATRGVPIARWRLGLFGGPSAVRSADAAGSACARVRSRLCWLVTHAETPPPLSDAGQPAQLHFRAARPAHARFPRQLRAWVPACSSSVRCAARARPFRHAACMRSSGAAKTRHAPAGAKTCWVSTRFGALAGAGRREQQRGAGTHSSLRVSRAHPGGIALATPAINATVEIVGLRALPTGPAAEGCKLDWGRAHLCGAGVSGGW